MKTNNLILISSFILSLFLTSCESDNLEINNFKFRLELSDGTLISESDILFYDSATHFLYLNRNLDFNQSISGFNILVNSDTIYKGIMHSCMLSSLPKSTFYITDCFHYGHNIVDFGYYPYSSDLRNDHRIINAFEESNLLRNGLKCIIDSIKVNTFDNYSEVGCKITIYNNDLFDYYIIDPNKMGEVDFNYFTGGLSFQNIDTKVRSFLKWSVSNPDYGNLTMNDFSILKSTSKVSYTLKSSDYYKMEKGFYKVIFRFCGWNNSSNTVDLIQDKGRIWVGEAISVIDSVVVE